MNWSILTGMCGRSPAAAGLLLAALCAQQVAAQDRADVDRQNRALFGLTAGGGRSDNIRRSAVEEEEGSLAQAGLLIDVTQLTRRLELQVDANVIYEHYADDTFEDDVVGGANAEMVLQIAPERLQWMVQDNFGQVATDPFAGDTPDNRENINYFTTGPDFTARFGSAASLVVSGRYSTTAYEISELDSDAAGGFLSLAHQLSAIATVSLNGSVERFEFDAPASEDYDRHQAFVNLEAEGSRTSLSVDLGYTEIETVEQKASNPLARLALTRRVSPASSVTFTAGTQFASTAEVFRDMQEERGVQLNGSAALPSADPFEYRYGSLGWDFERNRTSFGLLVRYGEETYETASPNDRELYTYDFYAARQLTRSALLRIFGSYEDESFESLDRDEQESRYGVAFVWNFSRTLGARLQLDHFDRDSSENVTEYTENRASLMFSWYPMGRR